MFTRRLNIHLTVNSVAAKDWPGTSGLAEGKLHFALRCYASMMGSLLEEDLEWLP